MILRFDSRFDSTFFGFKIRFEDSAESSNLSNLKIRESYDSTNTGYITIVFKSLSPGGKGPMEYSFHFIGVGNGSRDFKNTYVNSPF